ncbi:response regulator [Halobacteriovorax sp. HFRX-2_2]|uniref:response regulator n=1 Tax=unclassified Halobacteriovorax TaxID=2639665 RepID=UPI0037125B56
MEYSSIKALVVDDLDYIRNSVRTILNDIGVENIHEAVDGASALSKVVEAHENGSPYQIVFCDVHMPNSDGLDFLFQLRADERLVDLPVVMVSSENSVSIIKRTIELGANNYLLKPFSANVLEDKMKSVLNIEAAL